MWRESQTMSNIFFVAERAVWAVDSFLNRAALFFWMSTLERESGFREMAGINPRAEI
jgi:hypothetical protein